ncbi:MAG: mechanosensitive ion channel domain-containing protein [Spongiibacteraceae bacterium]
MLKLLLIVIVIFAALQINRFAASRIDRMGSNKDVALDRIFYMQKTFQFFILAVAATVSAGIMGVGFSQIDIFLSSAFAVIGIALFAQWSILSNITASVIIFFFLPYKVGQRIDLIDKDKEKIIEGVLIEITLFHLLIQLDSGKFMTYPTSMVFQNPIAYSKNDKNNNVKK